jgi:hypothetical protein
LDGDTYAKSFETSVCKSRYQNHGIKKDASVPSPSGSCISLALTKESSLYDAMGAIIGAELRSKFDAPSVLPSYLDDLLKELDERLEQSTHSERPTNR